MTDKYPRYIPSDVVKSHPVYANSLLKIIVEGQGSVEYGHYIHYARCPDNEGPDFNFKSWFAAVKWDVLKFMTENGVEL